MNKVILMGRLVKEPDVRYSQGVEPLAVAKYTLAVKRRVRDIYTQDTDFINCIAFGKLGEFAEKYLKKGQLISIVGRLQVRSWNDQEGQKRWSTDVIIDEQYFAENKKSSENYSKNDSIPEGFYPIDEVNEDNLPF